MERLIRPVDGEWTDVIDPTSKIVDWERKTGLRLPADYRAFMAKYDGGRVYPLMFDLAVPEDQLGGMGRETYLDPLYNWSMVESIWNGESFGRALPPGMLAIGSNPGNVELLLGVGPDTSGRVFSWFRAHSDWGQPGNDRTWEQASSFTKFMNGLYDNDEEEGRDYWYSPRAERISRPMEL